MRKPRSKCPAGLSVKELEEGKKTAPSYLKSDEIYNKAPDMSESSTLRGFQWLQNFSTFASFLSCIRELEKMMQAPCACTSICLSLSLFLSPSLSLSLSLSLLRVDARIHTCVHE